MPKKPTASRQSKRSRKKKKDLYEGNAEISRVTAEISELAATRKQLQTDLSDIIEDYNAKIAAEDAEDFLERLPLESVKDLQEFAAGEKKTFVMDILRDKGQLVQDQQSKVKEILAIDKKISENEIDLLLAKINCVIDSLDKKDKDEI